MQITETRPGKVYSPQLNEGPMSQPIGFTEMRALLVEHLRLLWNARRFLAWLVTVALMFGVILGFVFPKQYTSTVRLMPPDNQSNTGMLMTGLLAQGSNGLGALASGLLGMKNSGALFVGILHSRTAEDGLVERFNLKSVYRDKLSEDARRDLEAHTGISEDRKDGIITITVTDGNPKQAAKIANAYVEELDRVLTQVSASAAHKERVFLEDRLQAVKQDLDKAAQDFSQFSSKNGTLDIKEQGKTMMEAAATLQGQLIGAESELKELQQIYAPGNVRVKALKARVSELQQQLDKIGGKVPRDQNALPAANDYPSIRQLPLLGVTYADLYRQTKIQEAVYETLTQEYEIAKVQEAKETPSVKVLDPAEVPERKSSPKRLQIVCMSGFLAFLGGALFVFTKAWWLHLDTADPVKTFGQEIFQSANSRMPWASPNGSRVHAVMNRAWVKMVHREELRDFSD